MDIGMLRGKTICFAGSGGLDSMTIVSWLREHDVNVECVTADFGQPDEVSLDAVRERMLAAGARNVHIVDLKKSLANAGAEVIKSRAFHTGRYWNTTGVARHVLLKGMLETMSSLGVTIVSHGCTGRGNDQIRFQHITNLLQPEFDVYAPWRDTQFLAQFGGRKQMIEYCTAKKLPLKASADVIYSTDANLLGLTHEAGVLESLSTPASAVRPTMGVPVEEAPNTAETVTLRFEKGYVVAINGEAGDHLAIMLRANDIAGRHGVGLNVHLVEDRVIGIKSRGVYEAPGMELLGTAHEFMTQITLDERSQRLFTHLSHLLADHIYRGIWFDKTSSAAMAAIDDLSDGVTGEVTVKLYKGHVAFEGARDIPASLYNSDNASMEAIGTFSHADSEGYVRATGQSIKMAGVAGSKNNALLGRL
ncbi:MAG: argininosuccinate synthase [Deltaproteobacteria bacterium]|nr:argininosuccinate synthase [Deltaproteobacteria bacterium]